MAVVPFWILSVGVHTSCFSRGLGCLLQPCRCDGLAGEGITMLMAEIICNASEERHDISIRSIIEHWGSSLSLQLRPCSLIPLPGPSSIVCFCTSNPPHPMLSTPHTLGDQVPSASVLRGSVSGPCTSRLYCCRGDGGPSTHDRISWVSL